jgi:hypothetical protein
MDLLQSILNANNGQVVDELGRNLGLEPTQTVSAIESLLPALAGGLARNSSQPSGLESLIGALTGGRHQQYVDQPSILSTANSIQDGNGILGHILGSKDVSRQVAARASAKTGIGADVLKQMLPMLAAAAMGVMSRQASQSAAGAPPAGHRQAAGGGLMDMLTPMLDRDRDGSMLDDVLGMLGQTRRS